MCEKVIITLKLREEPNKGSKISWEVIPKFKKPPIPSLNPNLPTNLPNLIGPPS